MSLTRRPACDLANGFIATGLSNSPTISFQEVPRASSQLSTVLKDISLESLSGFVVIGSIDETNKVSSPFFSFCPFTSQIVSGYLNRKSVLRIPFALLSTDASTDTLSGELDLRQDESSRYDSLLLSSLGISHCSAVRILNAIASGARTQCDILSVQAITGEQSFAFVS